jgi:hypothetical protein
MSVRRGLLEWSSAANSVIFLACFTCINSLSSILAVGAGNAFLLAALTHFLEFRWSDEFAVDADVEAGVAGVVEFVGDERAGVVSGCEAGFAAAALGVAIGQI